MTENIVSSKSIYAISQNLKNWYYGHLILVLPIVFFDLVRSDDDVCKAEHTLV